MKKTPKKRRCQKITPAKWKTNKFIEITKHRFFVFGLSWFKFLFYKSLNLNGIPFHANYLYDCAHSYGILTGERLKNSTVVSMAGIKHVCIQTRDERKTICAQFIGGQPLMFEVNGTWSSFRASQHIHTYASCVYV